MGLIERVIHQAQTPNGPNLVAIFSGLSSRKKLAAKRSKGVTGPALVSKVVSQNPKTKQLRFNFDVLVSVLRAHILNLHCSLVNREGYGARVGTDL
jgi:predicted site-specific integrase-resolvase